ALVPMPSGSPWLTNSPPLCPAKPTSSRLPRPTASGRISSPKCSPLLQLRGRPTRLTRLPPTPTCWPFMSIKCAPKNRARQGPSTPVISFGARLGLDAILAQAGLSERLRQLSCAMTLNRLIHPASELATPDWIRSTALSDILQVDFPLLAEDALYRNPGSLHAQRVVIEAALAERERTLFGLDQTLFLYDVTSTDRKSTR